MKQKETDALPTMSKVVRLRPLHKEEGHTTKYHAEKEGCAVPGKDSVPLFTVEGKVRPIG